MADARIRVELTADSAKKQLKDYKAKKKKENKKAALLERREEKEKKRIADRDERLEKVTGKLRRATAIVRSPIGEATAAASQKFREKNTGVSNVLGVAVAAYELAKAANDGAIVLGGGLKEMGGLVGRFVGGPMVSVAETLQKNVFDQADKTMGAAKTVVNAELSFAASKIGLSNKAREEIAVFAYAENSRKLQIETREKELYGAKVAEIIKRMSGFGG